MVLVENVKCLEVEMYMFGGGGGGGFARQWFAIWMSCTHLPTSIRSSPYAVSAPHPPCRARMHAQCSMLDMQGYPHAYQPRGIRHRSRLYTCGVILLTGINVLYFYYVMLSRSVLGWDGMGSVAAAVGVGDV
ncbi:hypothetical protein K439DRAFT_1165688 [Ramaria rubella]|nr:hypothetical protein K439DRAFT_1165688 [Ramaria rubella]